MRKELTEQCEKYILNRNVIKKTYKWDSPYMISVAASIASSKNITLTQEMLKDAEAVVKSKTGVFSNFRGDSRTAFITMLAVTEAPETYMDRIVDIYQKAKQEWFGSEYLAVAAAAVADLATDEKVLEILERGKSLYKRMKKEHPLLTSSEDCVYACLMAFSEKSDDALVDEMEACFKYIKAEIRPEEDALQSLTHVLTISEGSYEAKCERLISLYNAFKEQNRKYSRHYEISVLGSLAISTSVPVNELVDEVLEIDAFLKAQKGYGPLSIDKMTRLMHACMLYVNACMQDECRRNSNMSAMTGAISVIASQHAATCACIAACTTAAASSSST